MTFFHFGQFSLNNSLFYFLFLLSIHFLYYENEKLKCLIFKCYSSEELITLNTLHEVVPPGTHFTAESTEAMRIKSLAQEENILMLRFEPATFVSKIDILTTTPIVTYVSSINYNFTLIGYFYNSGYQLF